MCAPFNQSTTAVCKLCQVTEHEKSCRAQTRIVDRRMNEEEKVLTGFTAHWFTSISRWRSGFWSRRSLAAVGLNRRVVSRVPFCEFLKLIGFIGSDGMPNRQ
jgi:hypothetical protein